MGEYTSTAKKGREIATAAMLSGVAIGVFYLSKIPGVPVPGGRSGAVQAPFPVELHPVS